MKDLIKRIDLFSDTKMLSGALMDEKQKLPRKEHYIYNEINDHMVSMYDLLLDIKKQYKAESMDSTIENYDYFELIEESKCKIYEFECDHGFVNMILKHDGELWESFFSYNEESTLNREQTPWIVHIVDTEALFTECYYPGDTMFDDEDLKKSDDMSLFKYALGCPKDVQFKSISTTEVNH
jgi:hypothetical protein